MPCDTIRTVKVDLASLGRIDLDLLAAALADLGFQVCKVDKQAQTISAYGVTFAKGKLTFQSGKEASLEDVHGSYMLQVVKAQTKRFGWAFEETTNTVKQEVRR